jgi:excisionase family DNA binding protein
MAWLTKKEAANYLRVSTRTLENLESLGRLKAFRLYIRPRKPIVRFRQKDLDELFLKRQKGRPREDETNSSVLSDFS